MSANEKMFEQKHCKSKDDQAKYRRPVSYYLLQHQKRKHHCVFTNTICKFADTSANQLFMMLLLTWGKNLFNSWEKLTMVCAEQPRKLWLTDNQPWIKKCGNCFLENCYSSDLMSKIYLPSSVQLLKVVTGKIT